MAVATALLLTAHLFTSLKTPVDFRLMPPGPDTEQTAVTRPSTPVPPRPLHENPDRTRLSPRPIAPAPLPVARGFGMDVPLGFAVRQIVPEGTRVIYGEGADLDALVSWVGDKPWNRALQDTIRPLQLRMTLSRNTLVIAR